MKKIAIDARMYSESGIGRYIRNLLEYLQKNDQENKYYILLQKNHYDNLLFAKNFHKILAISKWYSIHEQFEIPKILNSLRVDLVHFPHFNVPIFFQGKYVVTIHDLIHQHFQMKRSTTLNPLIYTIKIMGYKKVFQSALSKSLQIITPSKYVKNLLISEWQVKAEKINVTYEGVDSSLQRITKNSQLESKKILEKFDIKNDYIFYIGNAHPHKNVEGLVKAFFNLKKANPNLQLVLSGADHYFWQRIKTDYSSQGIIFTGYVTDEELAVLYSAAQLFVMPSFEEGFGIPLLEAFAHGTPVVSSFAGALPEIGGDAALYFDPNNVNDMIAKIQKILTSQSLRNDLITKGRERLKKFSWDLMGNQTLTIYNKLTH